MEHNADAIEMKKYFRILFFFFFLSSFKFELLLLKNVKVDNNRWEFTKLDGSLQIIRIIMEQHK
jgi:hypothetical protein